MFYMVKDGGFLCLGLELLKQPRAVVCNKVCVILPTGDGGIQGVGTIHLLCIGICPKCNFWGGHALGLGKRYCIPMVKVPIVPCAEGKFLSVAFLNGDGSTLVNASYETGFPVHDTDF